MMGLDEMSTAMKGWTKHSLTALGLGLLAGICLGQVFILPAQANEHDSAEVEETVENTNEIEKTEEGEEGDDESGEDEGAGEAEASPAPSSTDQLPQKVAEGDQTPSDPQPDLKKEANLASDSQKTEDLPLPTPASTATPTDPAKEAQIEVFSAVPADTVSSTSTPDPEEECGEIYSWRPISRSEDRLEAWVPIEDCDDPFGVDTDGVNYTYQLSVDGSEITDANELVFDGTKPRTFLDLGFHSSARIVNGNWSFSVYRHDEDGFYQVFHKYVTNAVDSAWHIPQLPPGEYAAVVQFNPIHYYKTLTPHDNMNISVQYFSVTHNPPQPPQKTGASSVLFLPGIQSTRLHQNELLFDDTLWPPTLNGGDIPELKMTEQGESVEDVYVEPEGVIDRVSYPGIDDIIVYDGFLQYLDAAETAGDISSWYAYAYDWRYDVFTVVDEGARLSDDERIFLLDQLQAEAAAAENGKATIIAHSNGGLLTKALMLELERRCSNGEYEWCPETLVDRIILVGAPQLGTPKAIQSVLHGDAVSGLKNLVYSQEEFRTTARNFPMAYGLLPFDTYFYAAEMNEPIVTFPKDTTDGSFLGDGYENGINTPNELDSFILGGDSRPPPEPGEVNVPLIGNVEMLRDARNWVFDQWFWRAPRGVSVHELVGVGQATVTGLDYLPFPVDECTLKFFACEEETIWKPVPRTSLDGDATVMARSAEGYDGGKETVYFDMEEYNRFAENENLIMVSHANLTEPAVVQQYFTDLLTDSASDLPDFLSPDQPDYSELELTEHSVHSPAHLMLVDAVGRRSGVVSVDETEVVLQEIPNSTVNVLGGSTYVSVPQMGQYTVTVSAYDQGVVSLLVRSITGDGAIETKERLQGIPVATGTRLSYSDENSELSAPLLISSETATTAVRWSWTGATSSAPRVVESPAPEPAPVDEEEEEKAELEPEPDSVVTATRVGDRRGSSPPPEVRGASTRQLSGQWQEIYQALVELQALLEQMQYSQSEKVSR